MAGVKRLKIFGDAAVIGNENNDVTINDRTLVRVTINGKDTVWERPSLNHKWQFEEVSGDYTDSVNGKVIQDTDMTKRVASMHPELGQAIKLDAGFEILTSKPYPIYTVDSIQTGADLERLYTYKGIMDSLGVSSDLSFLNYKKVVVALQPAQLNDATTTADLSFLSYEVFGNAALEPIQFDDIEVSSDLTFISYKSVVISYQAPDSDVDSLTASSDLSSLDYNLVDLSSLFAGGEAGGWYDPSDLSTLWKDVAGTVPVTTNGDLVARMDDKSGNGNHLIMSTSSKRPAYGTDGTRHWIETDGADDYMVASSGFVDGTDSFTAVIATEPASDQSNLCLASFGDGSGSGGTQVGLSIEGDGGSYRFNNGARIFSDTYTGSAVVLTYGRENGSDYASHDAIRQNKTDLSQTGVTNGTNTTASMISSEIVLGSARNSSGVLSNTYGGKLYGLVLVAPKLSDSDREGVETWLLNKTI